MFSEKVNIENFLSESAIARNYQKQEFAIAICTQTAIHYYLYRYFWIRVSTEDQARSELPKNHEQRARSS